MEDKMKSHLLIWCLALALSVTSDEKGPLKIETAAAIRVNSDGEGDFYESNEEEDQLRAKDLSPQRLKSKDDDLVGGVEHNFKSF